MEHFNLHPVYLRRSCGSMARLDFRFMSDSHLTIHVSEHL
jgi:hypothetical protein